jgi:hypothetical protein
MAIPEIRIYDTVQIKGRDIVLTVVGLDYEDEEAPKIKLRSAKGKVTNWGPASAVELVTPPESEPEPVPATTAVAPVAVFPKVRRATPAKKTAAAAKTRTKNERFALIAEGHYALAGPDGTLVGYKVDVPSKGRWEGYRFIRKVEADGTTSRITDLSLALDLLDRIAQDPRGAQGRAKSLGL